MPSSRLSGFYKLDISERRRILREFTGLSAAELEVLDPAGGLSLDQADHLIENVIGVYSLPLGIATNFMINGRELLIPMCVEEPSVVAACSHAALLAREGGGFSTWSDAPRMIGQLQILDLPAEELTAAQGRVMEATSEILQVANERHATLQSLGGGAQQMEVRCFPTTSAGPMLVVHLIVDVRDAMGANAVNTMAEAIAPRLAEITGGRVNLRILSNLADQRLAFARCRVPLTVLKGSETARHIIEAQVLAEIDPYRAATHNKGIMNGIDAVVMATGNDWRAAEAGAHAFAARDGIYRALTRWWQEESGDLWGELCLPLALGVVGGTIRSHPQAQLCLRLLKLGTSQESGQSGGSTQSQELAEICAAVGLAQNLGALRALATEGIQQGHMALHARQVALAAGAQGLEVEHIASQLIQEGQVRLARAQELLEKRTERMESH
ncbi:MAG: hydroxymethylglutaryl-CoA reductase, degradative [Chloroflexi bacterium]|nr:hydroxymethylglutaryl-CoA reductase, degradative [Chloroflexota bacterium]